MTLLIVFGDLSSYALGRLTMVTIAAAALTVLCVSLATRRAYWRALALSALTGAVFVFTAIAVLTAST